MSTERRSRQSLTRYTRVFVIIWVGVLLSAGWSLNVAAADNPLRLRAHHITASVADMQRAIQWYQSVLGFELKERGSHGEMQFAVLGIPGFEIALVRDHEQLPTVPTDPSVSPRWVHMVFSVPDPNKLFHELKGRGAGPYTHGNNTSEPAKSFLLRDSEGNEIEIVAE